MEYAPEHAEVAAERPAAEVTMPRNQAKTEGGQRMNRLSTTTLLASVLLATLPLATFAQTYHPRKEVFRDLASWPATAPGDERTHAV